MKMLSAFFLADFNLNDKFITLDKKESHHAISVRRIKVGEEVYLTNGQGLVARGKCTSADQKLEVSIVEIIKIDKFKPQVTVAQAVLKGERSDFAVELMTEVGVCEIVFWPAERSVAKIDKKLEKALQRWQQIATTAIKQSRQAWLPKVSYLKDFAQLTESITDFDAIFLLDFEASQNLSTMHDYLKILFIVGPEGGLTADEKSQLISRGVKSINVGNTVLRGSTAGAIAAALALN